VDFRDFERHARRAFEEIPDLYREGVDGLTVSRDAPAHPELPDVYTLGECLTEEHLSDFGSPETTRSTIHLYWGSFRALARESPDFDWDEEIWETLTHELRHHLESLAGDDALEDVDYAADESFNRFEGRSFDPWYYQQGEAVREGVYRVERSWYVEQIWSEAEFIEARWLSLRWGGREYRLMRPAKMGDIHFVLVRGLDLGDEALEIVIVRRRSWWEDVKRVVGTSRAVILESEADAEPVDLGE
jgi:zinicin-like metallopeptidase